MTLQATKLRDRKAQQSPDAERCGTTLSQGGPGISPGQRAPGSKGTEGLHLAFVGPQVPPSQASPLWWLQAQLHLSQAGERPFSAGGAGKGGDGCAGGRWGCKGDLGLSNVKPADRLRGTEPSL